MNNAQESNLSQALRNRKKQDKRYPHIVNVDNGRLLPNTEKLRAHPKYRVYAGPTGPEVTNEQRLAWVQGLMERNPIKVVNTTAEVFDIAKASSEDLVAFALDQYGAALDATKPAAALRREVAALAGLPAQEMPVASGTGLLEPLV
jgi:hypothetical protein